MSSFHRAAPSQRSRPAVSRASTVCSSVWPLCLVATSSRCGAGNGSASHRPRRAARGEDCRPAAAPAGVPRPGPPPAAPAGAVIPPGGQSAAGPPAHPRFAGPRVSVSSIVRPVREDQPPHRRPDHRDLPGLLIFCLAGRQVRNALALHGEMMTGLPGYGPAPARPTGKTIFRALALQSGLWRHAQMPPLSCGNSTVRPPCRMPPAMSRSLLERRSGRRAGFVQVTG
jgi:hypothetical protein